MARSRYYRSKTLDGKSYSTFSLYQTNRFKEPDTFSDVRTFEYRTKLGDRLDTLAAKFLNDDEYWYVIALVNNLTFPFITSGTTLKIPYDAFEVLKRI